MANLPMQGQPSPRAFYEQKYRISRMNLLMVVAFTAINLILLVTNANSYFLFSAFFPYFIASIGMLMCGRFPEEYYEGMEDMVFFDNAFFVFLLIVAIFLTLLYLATWFFSGKNRGGWLIAALVLFGVDTLGMLAIGGFSLDSIFDLLFHAWVIYYLIIGINAYFKLKNLPPEEVTEPSPEDVILQPAAAAATADAAPTTEEVKNSTPLREADKEVKHRVLLEVFALNKYDICYRRVKRTNELVINGQVYDELEGQIEFDHSLSAWVDGHYVVAGLNGMHSYITVDGETLGKKLRLY